MKLCLGCMQEIEQQVTKCPYCGYLEGTGVAEPYYLAPGIALRKRYLIGKVLGYGGFGITYIGYDQRLKRITAIKEYFPSDFATRAFGTRQVTVYSGMAVEQYQSGLERFHLEAQKLAKFTDVPEIVDIYDCFYENGTGYIVMEFLKGKNVKEILKEREKLPWEEAEEIILHVLDGLHVMHGAGMIHRDIAPDNIFITEDGQVKLLDFGAARYAASTYTRSLTVILKPGYAPEEQYRSRGKQGAWTDIYGVGASFYRMITGVRPIDSMERLMGEPLLNPSQLGIEIPADIEKILMQSLEVKGENRIQSAEEMKKLLLEARPHVKPVKPNVKPERNKVSGWAAVPVFLLIGAVFVIGSWWAYKLLEKKDSSISQQVKIDEASFPDPSFRAYVLENADTDGDGVLSEEECQQVRIIEIVSGSVSSLEGVEYFPNLGYLDCRDNQLKSLDLSSNPELLQLDCDRNSLTELDLSNNPKLVYLACDGNSLTELDLSHNPKIETVYCNRNGLTELDLSQNSELFLLYCVENSLTELNLSQKPALAYLSCAENNLTFLDLSQNPELEDLFCDGNSLTSLDLSQNSNLEYLSCNENDLTSLDLSQNPRLDYISCSGNNLTSLDLSNNSWIGENNLSVDDGVEIIR